MTPHLLVESEADMELGLDYAHRIAADLSKERKSLEISFPSAGLMTIFLDNLFTVFITNRIPEDHGLNLICHIPEGEPYE